jgi:hypothetical protein
MEVNHSNRTHLNHTFHKTFPSVCVSVCISLPSLLSNGSVKWILTFVARQWTGKHVNAATNKSNNNRYGYGFCATRTIEWLHCKLQTRPLVREGSPRKHDRKFQTATLRQEVISGRKSHKCARYQDILTDWLTVSRKETSTSLLNKHLAMRTLRGLTSRHTDWPSVATRLWLWVDNRPVWRRVRTPPLQPCESYEATKRELRARRYD